MSERFSLAILWIVAALAALVVALAPVASALIDGQYVPIGPDGFYHARRILDFAGGTGFYQFDPAMHVPEGSVITWPWMYDYVMGGIVRLLLALGITQDAMVALVHLPVLAFPIALLAILVIARCLGLGPFATLLAMLATAFFPLNQSLYGVGNVDHHFAEHLCVLGSIALALVWLRRAESPAFALLLGAVLGLSPGVHPALFILQLPVLLTLLGSWHRGTPLPRTTPYFVSALLASTLLVALPSLSLRNGEFHYYTLSWFQVYIAGATSAACLLLQRLTPDLRGRISMVALGAVALIPIAHQSLLAGDFFSGAIEGMNAISEVRSPLQLLQSQGSALYLTSLYSGFIWLTPVTLGLCAWRLWREPSAVRRHFWLTALLGIVLLLSQLRLQYFGSFALYLPWIVVAQELAGRFDSRRVLIWGASAVLLALACAPAVRGQLFEFQAVAGDPNYAVTRPLYLRLSEACREHPGVVVAHPFDGHYLRFHTGCAVIGNNFVVTRQHAAKIAEENRLLSLPAAQLRAAAPWARYLYVRNDTMFFSTPDGGIEFAPGEYPQQPNLPLVREMLAADSAHLPDGFRLLYEMRTENGAYARIFALSQDRAR